VRVEPFIVARFWERSQNLELLYVPHGDLLWRRTFGPHVAQTRRGYSGGKAFRMSSWNCAENQCPDSGALGSAPDKWLLLRGLPV
jgi:hypothetical protein